MGHILIIGDSCRDVFVYCNSFNLCPGDSFHVPVNLRHRMIGLENTELFKFSTQHLEEDSYRLIKSD